MKILKLIVLFGSGFVVGGIAVGLWSGHLFSRLIVSKEVDTAFQAAQQAEWLAELRLGETRNVMKDMENVMDMETLAICQWSEVRPPDEKTREARDGFLTSVKVYHESYPVSGNNAAMINALLAAVPGRNPHSKCKAGICRLDDQRLANLNAKTNSP